MKAMLFARLKFAATVTGLVLATGGAAVLFVLSNAQAKPDANAERREVVVAPAPTSPPQPPAGSDGLAWDATQKEYKAGPGEGTALFSFSFTNNSPSDVVINRVQPSCGCTTTRNLPALPWRVAAGASDHLEFVMNLAGRSGTVVKSVALDTSVGHKSLLLRVEIPPTAANTNGAFAVRK